MELHQGEKKWKFWKCHSKGISMEFGKKKLTMDRLTLPLFKRPELCSQGPMR